MITNEVKNKLLDSENIIGMARTLQNIGFRNIRLTCAFTPEDKDTIVFVANENLAQKIPTHQFAKVYNPRIILGCQFRVDCEGEQWLYLDDEAKKQAYFSAVENAVPYAVEHKADLAKLIDEQIIPFSEGKPFVKSDSTELTVSKFINN